MGSTIDQRTAKRAAEQYKEGKITFSEAAHRAGLTLWEMQQFLVGQGYVSSYSAEDLKQDKQESSTSHL